MMDENYYRKNRRGSMYDGSSDGNSPKKDGFFDENSPKKDDFFDSLDMDDDFSGEGPDLDDLDDFSGEGPELEEIEAGSAGNAYGGNASRSSEDTSADSDTRAGTRRRTVRELNTAEETLDTKKLKSEKEKKKKSTIKKIIGMVVLEIVTLACIFVYGYFLRSWNLIQRPPVDPDTLENENIDIKKRQEMEEGYWTFAVFGVDGRSASDLVSKGLNSDVIIIVNISQSTGEIRLCSVFRDTYLNISDSDSYRKINAAYANGGPEQALAALNKNLDLNIKNYVTFNWKGVADGINILGGIDGIELSKAELYYINAFITETVEVTGIGSHQLTSTGLQHLDGVQAVAYGRLRLMDSDFARTERQKKVIKAAFEKAKQSSFSVLNNIMVVCFPEVATNIEFNTVVAMAQNITKYYIGETGGFPWQRSSSAITSVGDVVVPATLESNVKKLHAFLFDDENYEPSDAVKRYSAAISEKTGIYKEGQVVDSVRTDGGLISTPKTKAAEESSETDEGGEENDGDAEAETDEDGNPVIKGTIGIDEFGNYIYPTDANGEEYLPRDKHGNPIYPTDEYGNIVYETDPSGNVINPTNEDGSPWTMPETEEDETEEVENAPGETSHGDDQGIYNEPGDRPAATRHYEGPGSETAAETTEGYGPGNPGGGTEDTSPNETVGGGDAPGSSTADGNAPGSGMGDSNAPGGDAPGGASTGSGPVLETTASGGIAPGSIDGPG